MFFCFKYELFKQLLFLLLFFVCLQYLDPVYHCGVCRVASNVVCPGGKSQCPQNQTCCQAASGSYVCCIYANVSTSCSLFTAILFCL